MTLDLHSLFYYVFGSSMTLELNTELVGNFDCEEEAGIARDFAIKDIFGIWFIQLSTHQVVSE